MSFAYIDSQGKEVPIPGPDALRLRIELGAITDSTQFYDAGSDRWAPASEHEIYRQLQRDISSSQSGGFTAPLPSAIGPEPPSDSDPTAVPDGSISDGSSSGGLGEGPSDPDTFEPWDPEPVESLGIGPALDEIVASGADDDPSHDELFYPQGASADELDAGMDGFTLADLDAPVIVDDDEPATSFDDPRDADPVEAAGAPGHGPADGAASEAGFADPESGGFDFGFGALEVEEEEKDEEEEDEDEDEAAAVGGLDPDLLGSASSAGRSSIPVAGAALAGDDTPDFGMAFEGGAPDDDFAAATEVEESVHAPSDDSPVAPDEASADGSEGADDPYRRTVRERRGPRSKPPRRPGEGGGAGKLVAVVVGLVVVAGGAWFVTGGSGENGASAEPVVELPDLPAELEPQLRTLARSASEATVAEFDSIPARLALAAEPAERWLSGPYLANASAFPGVLDYWEGVGTLLDEMIATEDALWETAFERALDSATVAPGAEGPLRNRALAGWAAAAPDRAAVHAELRGIVDASLELHAFLLRNEASITYAPGTGGGAGDPVLEAVPDTPELGDAMWDLVGDITVALDALGYLQQVETESLMDRVKAKLVATGFR
jgi:hypothetical protein